MYSDFALQMAGPLCGSEEHRNEVLVRYAKILSNSGLQTTTQ